MSSIRENFSIKCKKYFKGHGSDPGIAPPSKRVDEGRLIPAKKRGALPQRETLTNGFSHRIIAL